MQTLTEPTKTAMDPTAHRDGIASLPRRARRDVGPWIAVVVGAFILLTVLDFLRSPGWGWDIVASHLFSPAILNGLGRTVLLTVASLAVGFVIGLLLCMARLSRFGALRFFGFIYIWVTRALPIMVVLLFIYFLAALVPVIELGIPGLPTPFGIPTGDVVTQFGAALLGLSLYFGGKAAEIFRGGYLAVGAGQHEAVRVLGLGRTVALTRVTGPQAFRVIIPSLANEVVTMFKNTSVVTVIGYPELLTTVQKVYALNGETVPMLTVACIWYLVITSLLMVGQMWLERRFGRGFQRRATVKATSSQ